MSVNLLREGLYRAAGVLGLSGCTEINAWLGLEPAREARQWLELGKYFRLQRQLEELRAGDRQHYALVVAALADWRGRPEWLDGWVWYASHLSEAWLVRGIHGVNWAFQVHQPGLDQPQGPVAMHTFFSRLEQAEADLQQAAERDPDNPEVWAWLLLSGGALGCTRQELERRHRELEARNRQHLTGQGNWLLTLARQPDGSERRLLDEARRLSEGAPAGSLLHALIPQAYIESWARRLYGEGEDKATALVMEPGSGSELRAAWSRSFRSPQHRPGPLDPVAAGYFAVAFYLAADRQGVADAMELIGGYAISYPWTHLCRTPREYLHPGFVIDRVRAYPHRLEF